jgi:hypothetical protein
MELTGPFAAGGGLEAAFGVAGAPSWANNGTPLAAAMTSNVPVRDVLPKYDLFRTNPVLVGFIFRCG